MNNSLKKMLPKFALFSGLFFCSQAFSLTGFVIPQIPLLLTNPSHPQVLIALANSESMDGTLSGAIMPGSGLLASALNSLNNSSSPQNYNVPAGFTPPIQAANGSGLAPYTVSQGGNLVDNGPSRLNVAKAGVLAILDAYIQSTDFALEIYQASTPSVYNTWVYYMSPAGNNFSFTNSPPSSSRYVTNPCFNYTSASSTIRSNCASIAAGLFPSIASSQYMLIGASSDDPSINDVLYAGGQPGVFISYSGPTPATPYPPNFTLANYNSGTVLINYSKTLPSIGGFGTSPTNAGYVPSSPQVMYAARGFGYGVNPSANTGNIVIPMTSAGLVPTATTVAKVMNLFKPFLAPETNNISTTEIKASAGQSPIAGLLTRANTYLTNLANTTGTCPQKKYVILISDGLPTLDLSNKFWPPLGSASATGYNVTATFNADGSLNTTKNQALIDAISTITTLKNNGIYTYVIGLGAGVDSSLNPQAAATLQAMAMAGGTENYYPATSPSDLVSDLDAILISIQSGSFQTSAASVSSSRIGTSTVEYQANFNSSDTPDFDWTGNVTAVAINPLTGIPSTSTLWSAGNQLDNLVQGSGWSNSRYIATWNPTLQDGVPFQWANISTSQQQLLQSKDTQGQNRLNYLRGNTALEVSNGGKFRSRSHILGDIMDSQIAYVGPPSSPYFSSSYQSFVQLNANRQPVIYVGANDGMLHAFNAATGAEMFAFVPNGVFSDLEALTATNYNLSHLFYVNGSPQTGDVQFADSTWHTLLVGGENGGGNSIYALDITNPSYTNETNLASSVLWEFTDTDMGLSYSTPQIAQITQTASGTTARFAVFFGNGYNSNTNRSILYALDPRTGTVLRKIDLCSAAPSACNNLLPQGLSSVSLGQKDGLITQPMTAVYAGDLQGNLWAVNIADSNPNNWTVRLLFQARDPLGIAQPITTAPVIGLNPNYPRVPGLFVMFGTGQLLIQSDMVSKQTQSIYGVLDKPATSSTYYRSNLQQQTLTQTTTVPVYLTATSNVVNWNSSVGWYTDLPVAGQRLVTTADLFNGAFIATLNTPPANTCSGGFTSVLLELNFLTGGAFNRPLFDLNGDKIVDSTDNYKGAYVVGIGLSNSFANSPTIIGPNQNNNMVLLITQSNGTQTTVINPNTSPRKIGWWQLH